MSWRQVLLAALLVGGAVRSAGAYVFQVMEIGGAARSANWPSGSRTVSFKLNDRRLELLPNLAADSGLSTVVETAMGAWSMPSLFRFKLEGTVATTNAGFDHTNLITFVDTPQNREIVGGALATTPIWVAYSGGADARIVEADVVFNPQFKFATDGRADVYDVQDALTHELGHALGLEHSPIGAATMFPSTVPGSTEARTPELDDLAGAHVLYQGASGDPRTGAIAGRVIDRADAPVFGAHVVVMDANEAIYAGGLTALDGSYRVAGLPPGSYRLYAEPLDGPVTSADFVSPYYVQTGRSFRRNFRTTFLGGNTTPATVAVKARQSTLADPIRVGPETPTLNPSLIAWTEDGRFRWFGAGAVAMRPGSSGSLAVAGEGVGSLDPAAFRVGGGDVSIDPAHVGRGKLNNGAPFVALQLTVPASARPGVRSLYVKKGDEQTAYTGAVQILAP